MRPPRIRCRSTVDRIGGVLGVSHPLSDVARRTRVVQEAQSVVSIGQATAGEDSRPSESRSLSVQVVIWAGGFGGALKRPVRFRAVPGLAGAVGCRGRRSDLSREAVAGQLDLAFQPRLSSSSDASARRAVRAAASSGRCGRSRW